jgi:hypothetical protein
VKSLAIRPACASSESPHGAFVRPRGVHYLDPSFPVLLFSLIVGCAFYDVPARIITLVSLFFRGLRF